MSSFCPACETEIDGFVPGPRGRAGARCPRCDALERHRFVAVVLQSHRPFLAEARTILDVAPHGPTRRMLRALAGGRYIGLDLDPRTGPHLLGSLVSLPIATASIDFMICMHVLEHIPDDQAAVAEMSRVLSSNGVVLIQVPRRSGVATDEDPAATESERVDRFGQADHVRLYGDDFEQRLYANGLFPTAVWPEKLLAPGDLDRFGLQPREHLWICRTRRDGSDHFPTRRQLEQELRLEVGRRRRLELDPPVRIVRGIQRRLRRLRR